MFDSIAVAHIKLSALADNLSIVKKIAPESKVLAMIKCNAYGHGAIEVAQKISPNVDALGLMFLNEGLRISEIGLKKPIVILTGFFSDSELKIVDQNRFEVVVHSFEQLDILERSNLQHPLQVWLKIDTGMHRLGFQPHQVKEAYQRLMACSMVKKPLRLMTHFSDAENISSNKTIDQVERFDQAILGFEGELCLANSAAIFNWPKTRSDWIRPGLALYGVASSFETQTGVELKLKPLMTLTSKIIAVHELDKGEAVGYGSLFKCQDKMRVGTVAIGYGDGYPRNTIDAPILVEGKKTKLLGRVAMDMVGVDLTGIPEARIGSDVTLWGDGLPIEEVARYTGEIPYEMFCRLSSRVRYCFY